MLQLLGDQSARVVSMTMMSRHLDFSMSPAPPYSAMPFFVDNSDIPFADTATPCWHWPQQQPASAVSLSLYDTAPGGGGGSSSSLQIGHEQQPFAAAPAPWTTTTPMQLPGSSRYLGPAKELLAEFCSLLLEGDCLHHAASTKKTMGSAPRAHLLEASSSLSSPWGANPSLSSMDLLEIDRKKARLLSMVDEVDWRYRRYRDHMRTVELSFEAVAGTGAAQAYTKLATSAMSRHFRCRRDALMGQLRALREAMGDRDGTAVGEVPGASKGDTPRLRMLEQCLRQRRTFRRNGVAESYPWQPRRGLPERAVAVLRAWLFEHFLHPYPNDIDKNILARQTGLSRSQVSNWFINARVRLWKPMIEDMYVQETTKQRFVDGAGAGGGKPAGGNHICCTGNPSSSRFVPSSDGGQFHGCRPSLHGGGGAAVSLTLGLRSQPFASSMMQQQQQIQQSLFWREEEEEGGAAEQEPRGVSHLIYDLAM